MDRLNQLRGDAGDSTLDTSSPPSEAFMSANESSSKYFSLSEVDSTFSISPSKDGAVAAAESDRTISEETGIVPNVSPIPKADIETFKIGKHIEAANILSGGVNIFDDNENSYDGNELVIDDNIVLEDEKAEVKLSEDAAIPLEKDTTEDSLIESLEEEEAIPSKDTEVVLQIDGKNVDAIDIGNQLYLYRKAGEKELSAVQIIEDEQQQPSFKFLKVRENTEGNLEVYEEIQIEIPKEVPSEDGASNEKTHVPINDLNKVIKEPSCNKVVDKIHMTPNIESNSISAPLELVDTQPESKSDVNLNGKMKFNESRKSPLAFTPVTYHSTPNKEGIPLTKIMVDQQLHPSRHSDNVKKTIEVNTENIKAKIVEASIKATDVNESTKTQKLDTPIVEAKEGNSHMPIVSEVVNEDVACDSLVEVKEHIETTGKGSTESTFISESKENALNNSVEAPAEEKVADEKKTDDNLKHEEIKNNPITYQSLPVINTVKESCESTSNSEKEKDKRGVNELSPEVKKNVDDNNFQESEITSNEKKIEASDYKDHIDNIPVNNIVTSTTTMVENKDAPLNNEKTNVEKHDEILHLQSNDNADTTHLIDSSLPKTTSLTDLKENVETPNEYKIKKDVVEHNEKETDVVNLNTKNSVNEVGQCEIFKNRIDSSNICSKIDTNITKECDKPVVNIINKDNHDSKSINPEISTINNSSYLSTESKILNDTHTKDITEKVKDDSINKNAKQNELGLALTQKGNLGQKAMTKSEIESYNITSKDHSSKLNAAKTIFPKQLKPVQVKKVTPKTTEEENNDVPFGKWTEVNRQRFLNQMKETKISSNSSNTNQIKQTNDLNRRDVLKKFDSKRQSAATAPTKISDFSSVPKFSSKMETAAFVNKAAINHQNNPIKPVVASSKNLPATVQVKPKPALVQNVADEPTKESSEQRIIINSQELINNTIEGIITRALKIKTTTPVHMKEKMTIHTAENPKDAMPLPGSLDDIEMKMNELHGFSFSERSSQEYSQAANLDSKPSKSEDTSVNKNNKIPNLLPFKNKDQEKATKDTLRDDSSDEEIIEHVPITGDIDVSKQSLISLLSCKETFNEPKMDTIITEKDFDKFARRNSITYENCLTVKFDSKEKHNVVQTVVQKEPPTKKLSRNELMLAESKAKSSNKHSTARHQTSKIPTSKSKSDEDAYTKNHHSKVQIAYQSALTAKRNLECPMTMIEDKPVKVVFMDTNTEYTPLQLNVQGQELSPSKKQEPDLDVHSASESMDSDILDLDTKSQDGKSKSKHQRKQVLTPVELEPELQLIESELGFKVSPTKKRKTEEKSDKNTKNLVPKKSYLLNRSVVDDQISTSNQPKTETFTGHNINTAIDSLVKAAELIENQSESHCARISSPTTETLQSIPVKRGRGRPRKYPLPAPRAVTKKPSSPQKKPRLIDAKPPKYYSDSDESSDGEIVRVNWTMGKINENIVCPICSKLFRSEDVLFKHVKHCTGPSPNRSDSDKRSPRRLRDSQESGRKLHDSRSEETDNTTDTEEENDNEGEKTKKYGVSKPRNDDLEVIVIEDTPVKQKPIENKKVSRKSKLLHNTNLVCEFCGKAFRQLSYLVNHKLQHKNEDRKDVNSLESETTKSSVFSCEICKKEFRKLHHLVQHRLIHNPSSTASRSLRKTSSEVSETKSSKIHNDDTSAGFRCEPCDKSFRKLHHLVEHRETHDGINKKGNTTISQSTTETSKAVMAHYCDICKKVFKKLQDLLEHKEQHYETSSEKSDDKSVKSSLSTKDIIHECSLCYMVFPNEHSLTKHTVICLRKKRQSAAKQAAKHADSKLDNETPEVQNIKSEEDVVAQDVQLVNDTLETEEPMVKQISENNDKLEQVEKQPKDIDNKDNKQQERDLENTNKDEKPTGDVVPKKRHSTASEKTKTDDIETPAKIKKVDVKEGVINVDTPSPKKKTNKDKSTVVFTKNHKTNNNPLPVTDSVKPLESSDDEEIRYMLNPNYKKEESAESKYFMKISALKRNSLQIERPSSKEFLKRRISLQNPPKMPRLKATPIERKPTQDQAKSKVTAEKRLTLITEQTTDSDDSDVKYSFPIPEKEKSVERKIKRQSVGAKRKSLVGIAKRKSLGKAVTPKAKPKKRTTEIEHRCDCGQLFSSAALLSRHTTLAHTPPRIRRRRSPPPEEVNTKPTVAKHTITKPTITKPTVTKPTVTKPINTKPTNTKTINTKPINKKSKLDVTSSNKSLGVATRKSSVSNVSNNEMNTDSGKQVKSDSFKTLRSAKSVPGFDKIKKK
ncbi:uncharacterized protein LOC112049744 [Bicyclus anynana]|uniref:Uncharacterized protein LOC112049744 n=1 Tax=Bicyclus anynana TaxID=110368 RepID=A0A6J1NEY2_BICAN|nr:uncharacterized protein LOC112049744 [Bicyclus anynana]XP_023943528.2 uncharacterized protein LOC112049744 [Bicyclus anynana]XP_052740701.1 uncharacterized protein LOC112049744 [Bicyclus anynana]